MENLLTTAVLLPLVGAFLLFLFPTNKPQTIRAFAIAVTELRSISQFILKRKEVN